MQIDPKKLKKAIQKAQEKIEIIRNITEKGVRERVRKELAKAGRGLSSASEDELVEMVYQKIARSLTSYNPERSNNPFSWFMTIVDHSIIDYLRTNPVSVGSFQESKREDREPFEPLDTDSLTPTSTHRQIEAHKILVEALARVKNPKEREILILTALWPDLSYKEIIKITHHPNEAAARMCKFRALKRMRKILIQLGYGWKMFGEAFRTE